MRHSKPGNRLSRPADQRKAVLRSLATELLRHDEIVTTLAKAKAVRGVAEKMITLGKRMHPVDGAMRKKAKEGDAEAARKVAKNVHCVRQLAAYLYDKDVVKRVVSELAPRYAKRAGGYTRIIRTGPRRGDATPMAIIQLLDTQ